MRQTRTLWIGFGLLLVIGFLVVGTGATAGMTGFGMMGFGMLAMVAFWGAIIVGLVWMVSRSRTRSETEEAADILRRRYAAGEIDQETYERMRRNLAA